jgi:hypothetical protein
VLPLTLLAPEVVEAILGKRQPEGMALPALMEPFPVGWVRQLRGCADRSARSHSIDTVAAANILLDRAYPLHAV